ncbi:lytic transglycosylase domain-containing protein [Caballeronia sp.]|uniref:lytic transglycosylase domain-containing protein n=1 Tax=Caballeronia sp. TaxID=1931223 RepID=UPI003C3CF9F3
MVDFNTLALECAPNIHPTTLQAVVRTESGFNPFAIGVVGGHLSRQPQTLAQAVATAKALDAQGINFSMGLGQVNKANLSRYGLTYATAFDPCANLQAGADILRGCYTRAVASIGAGDQALRAAISCYYSGNFTRGLKTEFRGTSYVQRVSTNAQATNPSIDVPAISVVMDRKLVASAHHSKPSAPPVDADPDSPVATPAMTTTATPISHPAWDAFGDYACDGSASCK